MTGEEVNDTETSEEPQVEAAATEQDLAEPAADETTAVETAEPVAEKPAAAAPAPAAVEAEEDDGPKMDWYILKVAFNREDSIADALRKRVKMEGMEEFLSLIHI